VVTVLDGSGIMTQSLKSAAVSKTDQRTFVDLQHNRYVPHLGLGGSMLGYGLVGTIVVVLLILYFARGL
jgi:hypothetical protein